MPAQLIRCPTCQVTLRVPAAPAASRLRCPHCGTLFQVSVPASPTVTEPQTVDAGSDERTVSYCSAPEPGSTADSSLQGAKTLEYPPPTSEQTVDQQPSHGTLDQAVGGEKEPPKVQLPGYEVLEELGRGGMGVVYRARQQSLKRPVALKMILAGVSADDAQIQRFRTEAEAVAHVQHPNIVQIYEIGEHEGRPYFSLEYVDGGSLSQRLKKGALEPRQAAQLAEVLARAIQHAHQRGVIHRDLKPANILLMEDGTPKITDFGLAKRLEGDMGQTRSGSILGTPSYMAPEQAEGGAAHVGPLADVYALGAVLYELLTGRPPFRGETLMATLHQVIHDEVVPPSRLLPRLDRDLETICLKALAKAPGQRYASALALAQDLERYQAGEPILARREGLLRRAGRKLRRNAVVVSAGAGILLAAGITAYVLLGARTTRQTSSLTVEITTALESGDWSPQALGLIEERIARLETLDPPKAAQERQRLHERFGQSIQQQLHAPRLQAGDITRIEKGIAWLEPRDAARAGELRSALRDRLRQWRELFDLHAPFEKRAEVFAPDAVEVQGSRLRGRGQPILATTTPSHGTVLLEADFDPSWQETSEVGLILSYEDTHAGEVRQVVFAPDGKRLYSAGIDGTTRAWDVATGRPLFTLHDHQAIVSSVAISPDGKLLVSGSDDGTILVRHADTGTRITTLRYPAPVCLAFSPDGKRLLAGSWLKSVAAWDTSGWQRLGLVENLPDPVQHVSAAAAGNQVFSVSQHGVVCVCDLVAGKIVHTRRPAKAEEPETWALALDGHRFVVKQGGKVYFEEPASGRERRAIDLAREDVQRSAVSASGRMLAVSSSARLRLVSIDEERLVAELPTASAGYISTLAFTPEGSLVAVGLSAGGLALYDARTGKLRHHIGSPGYAFVLAAVPLPHDDPEGNRPAQGTLTFAQRRQGSGSFEARILRNGRTLRRMLVEVPAGPLHLLARRDHDQLELQVNRGAPLVFHDLLPLPVTVRAVLGVHCPAPAGLTRLGASAQTMPSRPSPLEQGDELFEHGSYTEALKLYQGQIVAARSAELKQEAQCRAGLCLMRLDQLEEAAQLLGPLAVSTSERWSANAACQLWIIRMRQNRLDDLDDLLTSMTSRFSREQLVVYVPDDVREQALQMAGSRSRDLVLFEPHLLRRGQIGVALADLFQHDIMRLWGRYWLARMYCMAGQEEKGLEVLRQLLQLPQAQPGATDPAAVVYPLRSITWLLRRRGEAEAGLKLLDRYLFDESGAVRALPAPAGVKESPAVRSWRGAAYLPLYLERCRLHASLGQWDRAEQDIDALIRLQVVENLQYNHHAACYLMKGFLCQRRGDSMGAHKAWKEGMYASFLARLPAELRGGCPPLPLGEALIQHLAMAALTGSLSDAETAALYQHILGSLGGGSTIMVQMAGLVHIEPVLIRDMWLSARGHEVARQMAFYDMAPREYFRCPLYLCGLEKARRDVMSPQAGAEEEQEVWQLIHSLGEAALDRRLSKAQLIQFGLTYKGTTSFLGWGGLSPTLKPGLRARAAYFLGLRFLRLNRPQDATKFFQTAVKDAGSNATLRRLAQAALDRLRKS